MQAKYSRANFLPCLVAKQYSTHDNGQNSCSHRFKLSPMLRSRRTLGFTLLEVMVALAIFATAAIALTKVAMQYTQATANAISGTAHTSLQVRMRQEQRARRMTARLSADLARRPSCALFGEPGRTCHSACAR